MLPSEVAISSATFYFDYKGEDDRGTPVKVTEVMKACGEEYCIHTNEVYLHTCMYTNRSDIYCIGSAKMI